MGRKETGGSEAKKEVEEREEKWGRVGPNHNSILGEELRRSSGEVGKTWS